MTKYSRETLFENSMNLLSINSKYQWNELQKNDKVFFIKEYPSRTIYKGDCICKTDDIDETENNMIRCWSEHNPTHDSEPWEHLKNNLHCRFNWFNEYLWF